MVVQGKKKWKKIKEVQHLFEHDHDNLSSLSSMLSSEPLPSQIHSHTHAE